MELPHRKIHRRTIRRFTFLREILLKIIYHKEVQEFTNKKLPGFLFFVVNLSAVKYPIFDFKLIDELWALNFSAMNCLR
jgi:hypothetical protein